MNKIILSIIFWLTLTIISLILIEKSKKNKHKPEKNLISFTTICMYTIFLIDYLYPFIDGPIYLSSLMPLVILAFYLFIRFLISLFIIAKSEGWI